MLQFPKNKASPEEGATTRNIAGRTCLQPTKRNIKAAIDSEHWFRNIGCLHVSFCGLQACTSCYVIRKNLRLSWLAAKLRPTKLLLSVKLAVNGSWAE